MRDAYPCLAVFSRQLLPGSRVDPSWLSTIVVVDASRDCHDIVNGRVKVMYVHFVSDAYGHDLSIIRENLVCVDRSRRLLGAVIHFRSGEE